MTKFFNMAHGTLQDTDHPTPLLLDPTLLALQPSGFPCSFRICTLFLSAANPSPNPFVVHLLSSVPLFVPPRTAIRLPCPSPSPRICLNSCPLSRWCYLTISSSATPFSICLQSSPASGSFPINQLCHQVARILEPQLQHQSFQWLFRVDFL